MSNYQRMIYIVDDEEKLIIRPLRRLARPLLRRAEFDHYQLKTNSDPVEALAAIRQGKENGADLALVVSDHMMPQMLGPDFLKEVKELFPDAPRIILTGYADKENAIAALNELELFQYVEKPWDDDQFKQLLLQGLHKYRQNKMERMFSRYVPVNVIEEYIDRNDEAFLIGKTVEATVMFLDIVDFTRLTEKKDGPYVVGLLNEYLPKFVQIIHDNNGMLDKFTGDGLMALFGVPTSSGSVSTDAQNGVKAAIKMIEDVEDINFKTKTETPLRIRIGLNTGKIVIGNIGSSDRVNYTAVSDTVNTAARIEDAARHFIHDDPACILISQSTYEQVKEALENELYFEPQLPTKLRGKKEKYTLYQISR
ncbi:MAG: response regulator [Chloroflexi bacterium]|nr:response regulator [Chloroflexota bacterium]